MTENEKIMQIDCKLTEKNLEKMMADGHVDCDLGMSVPLQSLEVKAETMENEDVQPLKEMLAGLKLT